MRRAARGMRLGGLALGAMMVVAGCAAPVMSPLLVTVTDSTTHAPVPGARVLAEVPSMNHPFSVKTLLGQTGPISRAACTDESGRAIVAFAVGRPVRIGVLAPTYPVVLQLIQEPWRGSVSLNNEIPASSERSLTVRVEPTGEATAPQNDEE